MAHYWRFGGSLLDVVAHYCIGGVVAPYWKCGGSFREMWWHIIGGVAAYLEMWCMAHQKHTI